MKLERLLAIIMLLLGRESVTAGELAQRFEVSRRTIYRDIEALALAGLPVVTAQGAGGGIALMESYCMERGLFSEQERAVMLLSLQALAGTNGLGAQPALEKLRGLFKGAAQEDWVRVEFAAWGSGRVEGENLNAIRSAVLQHRLVHFDYVGADGRRAHRTVEPMTLLYRGSAWYLWGFCRLREGFRTFRLSRMRESRVDTEGFSRRSAHLEQTDTADPRSAVSLILRFRPQAAQRVYDDYDAEQIRPLPDGTLLVAVTYPEGEWVYGHLLSHGPLVEVLAPAWVREVLRVRAKAIAKIYTGENEDDRLLSCSPCHNEENCGRLMNVQPSNQRFCQSCGMPMPEDKLLGTEVGGAPSQDYCTYCYRDGRFTSNESMEQMVETCVPFLVRDGMAEAEARKMMREVLPQLKRWKA